MAKITKIEPQKSTKGRGTRVNLYLDGQFAFALPVETLVKAGLSVGQELTEEETKDLIFKSGFQKLLDKALRFISFRPRSEREIKNYLEKIISRYEIRDTRYENKKKPKEGLIEEVIENLKKKKLINDVAFVEWWLEQRATFRPRGKFALKVELRQKGISKEIIDQALDQGDEISSAQKAAAKKMKVYGKLGSLEFRQKMSAFLARRGFSWETIKTVIDQKEEKR